MVLDKINAGWKEHLEDDESDFSGKKVINGIGNFLKKIIKGDKDKRSDRRGNRKSRKSGKKTNRQSRRSDQKNNRASRKSQSNAQLGWAAGDESTERPGIIASIGTALQALTPQNDNDNREYYADGYDQQHRKKEENNTVLYVGISAVVLVIVFLILNK